MAVSSGNANDYLDLLSKLVTFLTTSTDLVNASQAWTIVAQSNAPLLVNGNTIDQTYYLKAPGLANTDQIFINLRAFHNVASDYWNWEARGALGYVSSNTFENQPNSSPGAFTYLWNQPGKPIPYWFIANGQRVILIAKVGTVYEWMYLGFPNRYGTPGQHRMPLFIGASGVNASQRYSQADWTHMAFWDGCGAFFFTTDATWQTVRNWVPATANPSQDSTNNVWPWQYDQSNQMNWMAPNLDGTYSVFPARMECSSQTTGNVWGEFDGLGFVTGAGSSAEDTYAINGDTWQQFPNIFRSSQSSYAAVRMK
ncbi:hypothetical protein [Dyella terrae]|uniref:hypothetical protein n=1 Tax=Dyella terrae TaxID=522259 RepID=UPI001EFCD4F5|nr:hypothetical protein [Dyella terrae]ULU26590.1 hypothetical protein DYST_03536 [Dyella terrae]